MKSNPHIGSSLDDFLKEEGLYEDVTNYAVKRVLAWQAQKAMDEQGITGSVYSVSRKRTHD
jgi:hypothetical protein